MSNSTNTPANKLPVLLSVSLAVAVGGLIFFLNDRQEDTTETVPEEAKAVVEPQEVAPQPVPAPVEIAKQNDSGQPKNAPRGFRGLEFGMNVADVRESLPKMTAWKELEPLRVSPAYDSANHDLILVKGYESVFVPGQRFEGKTTVGAQRATCEFSFAVKDELAKMSCKLDALPGRDQHISVQDDLIKALTRRYGAPAEAPADYEHNPVVGGRRFHDMQWTWRDEQASLEIRSKFNSFIEIESEIVITNTSSEYQELVKQLEKEAGRRVLQAWEAEKAKKERAYQEKLKKLGDKGRTFEDDF
jgi:hypothetical protein